jgi:hypothetical protein
MGRLNHEQGQLVLVLDLCWVHSGLALYYPRIVSADGRAAMLLIDAAGLGVQKRSATPREPCCGLILRSTFRRIAFVIALPTHRASRRARP